MKKYPIYQAFILSFFSKDLYRDVYNNWRGLGFMYVLALAALICTLISANWLFTIRQLDAGYYADMITREIFEDPELTFEQNLNRILDIASQIPLIEMHENTASTEAEGPVFITDPVDNRAIAIIDMTGQYNSLEGTGAYLLLTKTRLVTREKEGEQVFYLSHMKEDTSINEDDLNNLLRVLHQIPLITITNGKASIEEEQPYYIYGQNMSKVAAIDTTGQITSLTEEQTNILLTEERLFIRNPVDGNITELYLSEINSDMIYSSIEYAIKTLQKALTWLLPLFILPLFILASFAFSVFMVILYGIIAFSLTKLFKMGEFEFEECVRLSAVASTPVIVLNTFVPHVFISQGLVYFLIAVGYLYFALNSNSKQENTNA